MKVLAPGSGSGTFCLLCLCLYRIHNDIHHFMTALFARSILFAVVLGLSACTTIKRNPVKVSSQAYAPTESGVLAEVSRDVQSKFGADKSAFHLGDVPQIVKTGWRSAR
jgi:hypothetical protein